jgi:hypothetical protein
MILLGRKIAGDKLELPQKKILLPSQGGRFGWLLACWLLRAF